MAQSLPRPTQGKNRIAALDVLRGFAFLGIFVMNVQGMAMVRDAYFMPSAHMDLTGINWAIWVAGHMFADMKFMALFSMLFGAEIIVMADERAAKGLPTTKFRYTRNAWLLVFGLIHAYFIWAGDILVTYALCAFVVFWFRNLSAVKLLAFGAGLLAIGVTVCLLAGYSVQCAPPDVTEEVRASMISTVAGKTAEVAAYIGSWNDAHAVRVADAFSLQTEGFAFFLFWRAGGLMLIGMGLFKMGVLSTSRTPAFYTKMILIGFGLGLPLVYVGVTQNAARNGDPLYSMIGPGMLFNYFGSLFIAAAYIGLIMRVVQSGVLSSLQARLAAVGRMAFTNYIAQSVIGTFIFYGFGLGLFGSVERWGQVLIVLAVWAFQLWLSPLWLRHYRFGPLEWLWRSLTYMKWQSMRRV